LIIFKQRYKLRPYSPQEEEEEEEEESHNQLYSLQANLRIRANTA
jgi:hypothetical protein